MKKLTAMLVLLAVLMTVLSVNAGAPTEYAIPEVGTEINGFVVTDVYEMESMDATAVTLEHEKTGATLVWFANDSTYRSYRITFRTPVYNDTGLAHVFEHASLGGSEKYPGSNLFFEMMNKTSNLYLNAGTYQAVTSYPMASTSEEQLKVYLDYYMNGVFNPLVVKDKHAMMREAYRYQLEDADSEITLGGIVYSEMLGALNIQSWAGYNLVRMFYNGSYGAVVSGGDPEYIPDMTLEDIQNFHETYYHPSNSMSVLTGDIYLPDFLAQIDGDFFSKYEKRDIEIVDDKTTEPEEGFVSQTFEYPVENGASAENAGIIYYSFKVPGGTMDDVMMSNYLCSYLSNSASPFGRLMEERMPTASYTVTNHDFLPSDIISFVAVNVNAEDADTFKGIVDEAIADLLTNGADEEVLKSFIVSNQFTTLIGQDSPDLYFNNGVVVSYYWGELNGDKEAWKTADHFDAHISEIVTKESVDAKLKEWFSDVKVSRMAVTMPVPGLKEEKDAALKQKLADKKAAMTEDEINELIAETKEFNEWQAANSEITMDPSMNVLTVDTLPEEYPTAEVTETTLDGARLITGELDSDLVYVNIITDASSIPYEMLTAYSFMAGELGTLGTEKYTKADLPAAKASVAYDMSMGADTLEYDDGTYDPVFSVKWYALGETLEDSFDMASEILFNTDFSAHEDLRNDAAMTASYYPLVAESYGILIAQELANSLYSPNGRYSKALSDENFLNYLNQVSQMSDEELSVVESDMENLRSMVLNKRDPIIVVLGNSENVAKATELATKFLDQYGDAELESVNYEEKIPATDPHTAVATTDSVVYNVVAAKLSDAGFERSGKLNVMNSLITDKILLPELRFNRSAYGAYAANISKDAVIMYTYRDPNLRTTFDIYATVGDTLRGYAETLTAEELEGYIISIYGEMTSPAGPISKMQEAVSDQLVGFDTAAYTIQRIKDIKDFKAEDIAYYAPLYDAMTTADAPRITVGAKSMVEEASDLYSTIIYDYMGTGTSSSSNEIMDVLMSMSKEELREMFASMDKQDLASIMSYVMDCFTDENGNVDMVQVLSLFNEAKNAGWTDEQILAASEYLEETSAAAAVEDEAAVAEAEAEAVEEGISLDSLFGDFFSSSEEMQSLYDYVEAGEYEDAVALLSDETSFNALLEGLFESYLYWFN